MKWNEETRRYENSVWEDFVAPALIGVLVGLGLVAFILGLMAIDIQR